MFPGKCFVVLTIATCVGLGANSARAEDYYMGHCTDDGSYSPGEVIAACTTFIDRAMKESWKQEYIPKALYSMGVAEEARGNVAAAKIDFQAVVSRAPGFFRAWRRLVELMTDLKGSDSAIKAADLMIAAHPNNAGVLNSACWNRAVIAAQFDVALANCNESLRMEPGNAETLNSRAFVEYRLADYVSAIKDNTAALATSPKDAGSLYMRGLAELKSGNSTQGNADIEAAKALDQDIASRYAKYGVTP
ncbi:MAG TPA: tetratricopeptide repeat protein [Rhizomicrobium sp.]|nr:tetratricopeptide repeat protein [Rhizomicrobium sp.]